MTARRPSWIARAERGAGIALDALGLVGGGGLRAVLTGVTLVCAVVAIGTYVALGVAHIRYPYEVEWMEGGVVDAIHHMLTGGRLYEAPRVAYTPFIYAPLYFYVGAGASALFGEGLATLRVVSFVASIGATSILAAIVYHETQSRSFALLASAFFLATYRLGIAFLDLARVDSLFVLLLLAMVYTLRFHPSRRGQLVAAALGAAAFLTKQSGVFVVGCVAVTQLASERRRGAPFALAAPIFGAASFLILNVYYGGWLYYFAYWVPRQHPSRWEALFLFWTTDLLEPLAILALASVGYLALGEGREKRLYGAALFGALVTGLQGRIHVGGWTNVDIPLFAMLSLTGTLGLHLLVARVAEAPRGRVVAMTAALAQFVCLAYDPRRFLPTPADRAAGDALVRRLRDIPGDVFFPAHGGLLLRAGKHPMAQEMAMTDIVAVDTGAPGAALRDELRDSIAEHRYAAAILDTDFCRAEVEAAYNVRHEVFPSPSGAPLDAFATRAGMRTRPRWIYSFNPP